MREVEAGAYSVHLNIRILPFTYGLVPIYIIIRSTCAVSRWPFPGVFAMCFMGFDGLFSLSETMIVTLFLRSFCKATKLYIYF